MRWIFVCKINEKQIYFKEKERDGKMICFLVFLLQYILGYCGHFIIFETCV